MHPEIRGLAKYELFGFVAVGILSLFITINVTESHSVHDTQYNYSISWNMEKDLHLYKKISSGQRRDNDQEELNPNFTDGALLGIWRSYHFL